MKYNVILIHTHDTGRFLSPYGYCVPSQNLKNFCEDALLFRSAFCASPTCSPSRSSIMTSMYPHNNGMLALSQRGTEICNVKTHMAQIFQSNNYQTVLCGVQHEKDYWRPNDRGQRASSILGYQKNICTSDINVRNDEDLLEWDYKNALQIKRFLKTNTYNKPLFLSYGMHATHRVYPKLSETDIALYNPDYIMVPPTMMDTKENREDTACLHKSIACFDRCFKEVIDALKENNIYDNSIIIYTTDHGLANPFSKCNLLDAGIGVSFALRVPKMTQTYGKVYDGLMSQIDVLPTLCDILQLGNYEHMQGKSFMSILNDIETEYRSEIFAEVNFHTSYEPQRCIRTSRYKYIEYYDKKWNKYNLSNIDESAPKELLMKNNLKERKKQSIQLYDLLYDPNETNNLSSDPSYQCIKDELCNRLYEWREKTDDYILEKSQYLGKIKVNRKDSIKASSSDESEYESLIK